MALRRRTSAIAAANSARALRLRWQSLGREPNPNEVEAATWQVYRRGPKVTGVEYVEAIAATHAAGRKMAAFLANYDVILSTVVGGPPPPLGYFDMNGDVATFTERVTEYSRCDAGSQRHRHAGDERAAALDGGRAAGGGALCRSLW